MELGENKRDSVGYLTNLAARLFTRALERRLEGGNPGPMPVFLALVDGRSLTQKELVRLAVVEQPTMAATLNRMERDGLIVRTPDPKDRRSALISLTPLGMERAKAAVRSANTVDALGRSPLTAAEHEQFLGMVHRIIDVLYEDGADDRGAS